jgi:hypothetical protein
MLANENAYEDLHRKARGGEVMAAAQLKQRLERDLVYIVRRALRDSSCSGGLEKRIQMEARQVGPDQWRPGPETPESLIWLVTRRMLLWIVAKATETVAADGPLQESVAAAKGKPADCSPNPLLRMLFRVGPISRVPRGIPYARRGSIGPRGC